MILSRVAETIYWMQRYRERAENTARLLEVNLNLNTDAPREIGNQWSPMIQTTGVEDLFHSKFKMPSEKNVINFLTFELNNPNSILNCLRLARENARSIREVVASEIWDEINTTYLFCQKAASKSRKTVSTHHLLNRIKRQCQLVTAISDTCMLRNEAWDFGRLGNLIERADMTTRILDAKYFMILPSPEAVGSPHDNIQWRALLKSVSALETYQKLWHSISAESVVGFLILNKLFPRSVLSCVKRVEESLKSITEDETRIGKDHPLTKTRILLQKLESLSGKNIIEYGLHEFIDDLQIGLGNLHQGIYNRYFLLDITREDFCNENISLSPM